MPGPTGMPGTIHMRFHSSQACIHALTYPYTTTKQFTAAVFRFEVAILALFIFIQALYNGKLHANVFKTIFTSVAVSCIKKPDPYVCIHVQFPGLPVHVRCNMCHRCNVLRRQFPPINTLPPIKTLQARAEIDRKGLES